MTRIDLFKSHSDVYIQPVINMEMHTAFLSATLGINIINLSCHCVSCEEANYPVVYGAAVKVL